MTGRDLVVAGCTEVDPASRGRVLAYLNRRRRVIVQAAHVMIQPPLTSIVAPLM
jgi:hypothetical protein